MLGVVSTPLKGADMFKRIRSTCHEGNVCPTLILDTETREVFVQGRQLSSTKESALGLPDGEGVVSVPAELLYGLIPEDFHHDETEDPDAGR